MEAIGPGDEVEIDLEHGVLRHKGVEYSFPPLPETVLEILQDGGLIPHLKKAFSKGG